MFDLNALINDTVPTPILENIPDLSTHGTFPLVWDNTMRSSFVDCPRLFFYRFVHGLVPNAKSVHLVAGEAFAKGIEVFRRNVYENGTSVDHAVAEGLRELIRVYGDFECPPDSAKNVVRLMEALRDYSIIYSPTFERFPPVMFGGKAAVEFNFAWPIEEVLHPVTQEPLIYCGRFDALVQQREVDEQMWICDEKTTKGIGPKWANQWKLRSQFMGYAWGSRKYNYPVVGAVVRGIAVLKGEIKHAQSLIDLPSWKIEMWYAQLVRDLQRAIRCWEENHFDYNFASHCSSYSGCAYMNLCNTPQPENWIANDFKVEPWSPLSFHETLEEVIA
jgi:hypothetical protein